MGDLLSLPADLSNSLSTGDFSAPLADLMPTASLTNILIYGAGIFAWWKLKGSGGGGGSSSSRRRTLAAARRKASAIMADAEAAA
jgi:hypothetical protein